jgi:hypothetical protein
VYGTDSNAQSYTSSSKNSSTISTHDTIDSNSPTIIPNVSSAFYRVNIRGEDNNSNDVGNNDGYSVNEEDNQSDADYFTPHESATVLQITSKDDEQTEEQPNLNDSKLKTRHRKHTRYRYINQPSRFRSNNDNIMNYLIYALVMPLIEQ